MRNELSIDEKRIFNFRKELARQVWAARSGQMDMLEALENTRDLVALCPEHIIEIADRLQHKVMNQITKKYGKIKAQSRGIDMSDMRVPSVNTREYLQAVKLPSYMVG